MLLGHIMVRVGDMPLVLIVEMMLFACCKPILQMRHRFQRALVQSQLLHVHAVTSYRSMVTRMRPPPEAILALQPGLPCSMSARSFCSCPTNFAEEPSSQSRPSAVRIRGQGSGVRGQGQGQGQGQGRGLGATRAGVKG